MDYKKIVKVWCPALNDDVIFNSMGIRHLLRKRGELRPKHERERRLGLLRYAVEIISDSNASIVIVVVRQFERGNKHFLSVY